MKTFSDEVYQKRQLELSNRMVESNCDLYFCPPSSDLEYLTGTLRRKPTFGNISYTHGWVCGAFFRPFKSPIFVLPRMVAEFDMPHGATGEKIIINETDDGDAIFEKLIKELSGDSKNASLILEKIGIQNNYITNIENLITNDKIQTRLPYIIELK